MSSKKTSGDPFDLDLERDMPLTPADFAALAQARRLKPLGTEDYQRWVELIERHHPKPHHGNTDADEPFEL